jgi:hypothetical protein
MAPLIQTQNGYEISRYEILQQKIHSYFAKVLYYFAKFRIKLSRRVERKVFEKKKNQRYLKIPFSKTAHYGYINPDPVQSQMRPQIFLLYKGL